jgi:hypothetical protein
MPPKTFRLAATVKSQNLDGVRAPIENLLGPKAKIDRTDDGWKIDATVKGETAKELNRQLLSEMRRVEKRTVLRAEWTADGVTEKFFDYVPKGTKKAEGYDRGGTSATTCPSRPERGA